MNLFDNLDSFLQQVRNFSECSNTLLNVLTLAAIVVLACILAIILFSAIQASRLYVFSQFSCLQTNYVKKYGKWAIVTGSTDGIGLAMARDLARRGHWIILVARNEQKLAATKSLIEEESHGCQVVTVKIDLSDSSKANFDRAIAQIDPDNRDIGVLINNAGVAPNRGSRLHNMDLDFLIRQTNVNALAAVIMTRLLIPSMKRRGRGLIVNVSSIFALSTIPYLATYSPTKSFLLTFTEQMKLEYADYPIEFVCLTPGFTLTNMYKSLTHVTLFSITPDVLAKSAINSLSTLITPSAGHPKHAIIALLFRFGELLGLSSITRFIYYLSCRENMNLTPKLQRKVMLHPVLKP